MQVLVVDDDVETCELIAGALRRDGHQLVMAFDPKGALEAIAARRFDVVVLDVMLDQASGLTLCTQLRSEGFETPILFLSARGTVHARVEGLDAGGDDYMPKPFAVRELVARARALGRRGPALRASVVHAGDLVFDFQRRLALCAGREVPITAREWELLRVLADARGRVVSFDDIVDRVWGETSDSARASLKVIMSRLRGKLGGADGESVLRTARGLGYMLETKP